MALTHEELKAEIERLSPATGTGVVFNGVRVHDADLLEALRFQLEEVESFMRGMHATSFDIQRVLEIFVDEGMIIDHRQENFD